MVTLTVQEYNKLQKENKQLKEKVKDISKNKLTSNYYRKKTLQKYNIGLAKRSGLKQAKQQILVHQAGQRPISTATRQLSLQEQQAQARQRRMGFMGSRAEALEIEAVNFNEVPLLHTMERERTRLTSPPHFKMAQIEKDVVRSFPQ